MHHMSKYIVASTCVLMVALAGCSSPSGPTVAPSQTSTATVNTTAATSRLVATTIPQPTAVPETSATAIDATPVIGKVLIHITTSSDWTNLRLISGGTWVNPTNVSSSPEAAAASIKGNLINLSQPLARAQVGKGVEMTLDVSFTDLIPSDYVVFEIQRGFIGSTRVEISTYTGEQPVLLKTFTWDKTNTANGNTVQVRLLAADLLIPPTAKKIILIYDDDGSRDGMAALLYLLSHSEISIEAINISYGEAHPKVYIQHVGRVLGSFGIQDIPLGAGQDAPLAGGTAFPDWLRQLSDNFWNVPLPNADKTYPFQDAPKLIVSTINQASEPVTIFLSGPFTNLAQALRLDPGIRDNIAAVYIMGGAVYSPGNVTNLIPDSSNTVAEWNIYADPQAAKEVFESGLDMYMVPLDATNQVILRKEDILPWHKGDGKANLVADLYDIMFNNYGFEKVEIFDLVAAAITVKPELCVFQSLRLDVITDGGITSGQTVVVPNGEPNFHICLRPNVNLIKQNLNDTFSTRK